MTRRDNPLLAWHASPYDLPEGRFGEMRDVSGKGQGAASYGRGAAYVAENPKVSGPGESEYMKEFASHPAVQASGWKVHDLVDGGYVRIDDSFYEYGSPEALDEGAHPSDDHTFAESFIARVLSGQHDNPNALKNIQAEVFNANSNSDLATAMNIMSHADPNEDTYKPHHAYALKSYLDSKKWRRAFRYDKDSGSHGPYSYKVALHLGEDNLLDWDTPLEDHHPEMLKKITDLEYPEDMGGGRIFNTTVHKSSGQQAYQTLTANLNSDFAATEALHKAGIHGIRYKDQGSRNEKPKLHFDGKPVEQAIDDLEKAACDEDLPLYDHLINTRDAYDHMHHSRPSINLLRSSIGNNETAGWIEDNHHRFELVQPKPTYNYVVFHPDFIDALEQYDIQGRRVKAFAPKGIKLKSVDHDPFDGEGK